MPVSIETVRDQIAWSYANLARAHAAVAEGAERYNRIHHIIRSKLFNGIKSGKMSMRSLYHDERLKMVLPQSCAYCGSVDRMTVDHLIPRCRGGADESHNLVWACRACNSSKRDSDLLRWMVVRNTFPSLYVLRRYLKIVSAGCDARQILEHPLADAVGSDGHPFALELLPHDFPPLSQLTLWVEAPPASV